MVPSIKKAYFEITNVCNLSCSFCPGTKRKKRFVSAEEFRNAAEKLKGRVPYLYLHLMGEPTLHPDFSRITDIAAELGFKVILTTNGTTLTEKRELLLRDGKIYKISISLHSFEANDASRIDMNGYLDGCFDFARCAAEKGIICVLRLWNLDGKSVSGQNALNPRIMSAMRRYFEGNWAETRSGMRISEKVFLEFDKKFNWPDSEKKREEDEENADFFCHGLRDQIGILCDGTVVPCCLDSEGGMPLGNIFESDYEEIMSSPRVKKFYDTVSARRCPSALCRSCGYAERFTKKGTKK